MKRDTLRKLLTEFRNELGSRKKAGLTELFSNNSIELLSGIINELWSLHPSLTDDSVCHLMEERIMSILRSAGNVKRTSVNDSVESLMKLYKLISQLNMYANMYVFGSHDITYATNKIKEWLGKDIEILQAHANNNISL